MSSRPPFHAPELPKVGDVLVGKYRLERVLGQGGMGIVYQAQHELLGQRVAIKLLLSEAAQNADATSRFLNEARAAARIQSENVARVSDVGLLDSGTPYMVMEFLEGADLSAVVASRGRLSPEQAVDYLLQALEAIAQAHALGIVHRDLKPANLFLASRADGTSLVKVLDFGISKTTAEQSGLSGAAKTSTQAMLGSPYYMSPEQLRSSKNVDLRTDIWALGIILFELLIGATPYVAETLGGLFAAILENEPPSIRFLRHDVPVELELIYKRCLTRNPDGRYQNAQELALALAPLGTQRGEASVDRILAVVGQASQPDAGGAGGAPATRGQATGRGQTTGRGRTDASWGNSRSVKAPSRAPLVFAIGLGVVVLGGGGVFFLRSRGAPSAPIAGQSAGVVGSAAPLVVATMAAPDASIFASAAASAQPAPSASAGAAHAVPPADVASVGKARPASRPFPLKPAVAPHPAPAAPGYDPLKDARH